MMKVDIDIRQATDDLRKLFSKVSGKQFDKATYMALNETAKFGRKEIARVVKKYYNDTAFTLPGLSRALTIKFASSYNWQAIIYISGKKIPLKFFSPKNIDKVGISVSLKKGQRKVIKGAFFLPGNVKKLVTARGQYNSNQFNFRYKRVRSYPQSDLPVKALVGLSIPQTFANDHQETVRDVKSSMEREYPKRLARLLTAMSDGSFRSMRR